MDGRLRHSAGRGRTSLDAPRRRYGDGSAAGDREVAGQSAEAKDGVPTKPASWGGKDGVPTKPASWGGKDGLEREVPHLKDACHTPPPAGALQGPGPLRTHRRSEPLRRRRTSGGEHSAKPAVNPGDRAVRYTTRSRATARITRSTRINDATRPT